MAHMPSDACLVAAGSAAEPVPTARCVAVAAKGA